ncbi:RRP15-like protein [Pelodytes ibericus]
MAPYNDAWGWPPITMLGDAPLLRCLGMAPYYDAWGWPPYYDAWGWPPITMLRKQQLDGPNNPALVVKLKVLGSEGSSDVEDDAFSASEDADSENEEEVAKSDPEIDEDPNKGWADAMAKILNKQISTKKSSAILVKSKVLEKEKEKDKLEKLEKKKQLDKKRQWEMMCRVKPDVVRDKEVERNLQRIATRYIFQIEKEPNDLCVMTPMGQKLNQRGVVQLFNAVRTHQGNVNEKIKDAGGSERKRSKLISSVSKKDFINVLRGKETKAEQKVTEKRGAKKVMVKSENSSEWNILRDDFMMGATMKDWDKDSDGEANEEPGLRTGQDNSASDSDR